MTRWTDDSEATANAQDVLARMNLDQKVDMLHGEFNPFYGFYNGPIDDLGIPALTMADGPIGVRIADPNVNEKAATQLPAGPALAATWDLGLIEG